MDFDYSKYKDKCPERDDKNTSGVLLSDEIKHYATKYKMIDPFDEEKGLKPAGYELSLGDEYTKGGRKYILRDEAGYDELVIPPFEVAIVSTRFLNKIKNKQQNSRNLTTTQ